MRSGFSADKTPKEKFIPQSEASSYSEKEQLHFQNFLSLPPWVSGHQAFWKLNSNGRSESMLGCFRSAVSEDIHIKEAPDL